MALGWKIVIGVILALIFLGLLKAIHSAMRKWRSSNLFDRQYRFPMVRDVPLRLGAGKSGGTMAALLFDTRIEQTEVSSQKPGEKPLQ